MAAASCLILMAGVLWSTMGLGVRMIEHASAIQILFYRSLGVLPVLLLFIAISSGFHPIRGVRAHRPAVDHRRPCSSSSHSSAASSRSRRRRSPTRYSCSRSHRCCRPCSAIWCSASALRLATWVTMAVAAVGVAIMVIDGHFGRPHVRQRGGAGLGRRILRCLRCATAGRSPATACRRCCSAASMRRSPPPSRSRSPGNRICRPLWDISVALVPWAWSASPAASSLHDRHPHGCGRRGIAADVAGSRC